MPLSNTGIKKKPTQLIKYIHIHIYIYIYIHIYIYIYIYIFICILHIIFKKYNYSLLFKKPT